MDRGRLEKNAAVRCGVAVQMLLQLAVADSLPDILVLDLGGGVAQPDRLLCRDHCAPVCSRASSHGVADYWGYANGEGQRTTRGCQGVRFVAFLGSWRHWLESSRKQNSGDSSAVGSSLQAPFREPVDLVRNDPSRHAKPRNRDVGRQRTCNAGSPPAVPLRPRCAETGWSCARCPVGWAG